MRSFWLSRLPAAWGWILIPTYKIVITVALLAAAYWIFRRLTARGWQRDTLLNLLGLSILAALLGARIAYICIENTGQLYPLSEMLRLSAGGYSLAGGAVAASVTAFLYLRVRKLPFAEAADAAAPAMGLAVALARVGCFLGGCDFGIPSSLSWAVRFPPGSPAFQRHTSAGLILSDAAHSLPVHPLQLYEALLGLGLMSFALYWTPRRQFRGQVYLLVVLFYCTARFGLDFLRDPWMSAYWGPLLSSQILALIGIAVSLLLYARFRVSAGRSA